MKTTPVNVQEIQDLKERLKVMERQLKEHEKAILALAKDNNNLKRSGYIR